MTIVISAVVARSSPLPDLPMTLRRSRNSHSELFGACALDLHSGIDDEVGIEGLVESARAGDAAAERGVVEFAFAAGRSAVISSSGELPPNLVGVWQGSWAPAWSGAYTLNGNVQLGSMAGLYNTGTPELLLGLFRLHHRFLAQYRDNAARVFDCPGYFLPTHISGHGFANHHSTEYPHWFWYGSGAWALRSAYDYYSATGDTQFVRDFAWPFAAGVLEFLDAITVDIDGVAHFVPSFSPENTPGGATTPLSVDATMDIALLRDAVRIADEFAHVAGEPETLERWAALAGRLAPYRVASDGALAEWAAADVPDRIAHRHVSHLYPFWYSDGDSATGIRIEDAARTTIAQKADWRAAAPSGPPGNQEMAFGLSSIGIAAARLGDTENAYRCALWLARDHFEPNAISRHDQGSIFNIDACGGLPALVAEMLLSTSRESVRLLPALPEQWPTGSVRGLTGRGGIVITEMTWTLEHITATISVRGGGNDRVVPQIEFPRDVIVDGIPVRVLPAQTVEHDLRFDYRFAPA
ncbi:hypothetical protein NVV95_01055 [Herbiconiux sp. CPCC 205716]|uniref:Glycosyl hydrolase family 95 N-terminal domain-containing protein n=1 Tax=Herbiconiux gentiana TaxID=2970912 RepID=A0ABT2GBV1_9MICO|nr:hypothetical protein [Herbiconiux gentiana]MCS5713132.1 hypothetical protein [Herbiconiux gentiana]